MALMKAVQINEAGADFVIVQKEIPEPQDREVLIKVEACGDCHGDAVAKHGQFPGIKYPRVPGHEVVGIIDQCGPGAADWKKGTRVGVGWSGGHCLKCSACGRGV